jgi:hypothetical protein
MKLPSGPKTEFFVLALPCSCPVKGDFQILPASPRPVTSLYILDPFDAMYEEEPIVEVTESPEGWEIKRESGWIFWVPREHGVEPHVGDIGRFYGRGIGYLVRGLLLNGKVVFYRTEDEQRAKSDREVEQREVEQRQKFEADRADHDRRIAALPDVFQERIARFQGGSPDFRWRFEGYELSTCEQAVAIADALKTPDAIIAFFDLPSDEQKSAVPDLSDDHSGNTFGCACRLARWYVERPELVVLDHGALTPLVGCEEYGCPHPAEVQP